LKRLSGADERAVMLESANDGRTWRELPMRIALTQLWMARAWFNWPPDNIDRVANEDGTLVAYFEDGWMTWERGCTWKATYQGASRRWRMTKLDCI
jgi:hypothetical protein